MRETGLSVPDAAMLAKISDVLGVCPNTLLGLEPPSGAAEALRRELEEMRRREARAALVGRKRGLILSLSFLTMTVCLLVDNEILSVILAGLCMLATVVVLLKNLTLLTGPETSAAGRKAITVTGIFSIVCLICAIAVTILTTLDILTFSKHAEKICALALICAVMVFAGIISPKLPFNRHTGLRLPWTVLDEGAWNLAHRVLGCLSVPLALLYVGAALTIPNFEAVTLCVMALWIGIPGLISGIYYCRRFGT